MIFSEDQLTAVQNMAGFFYTPEEIAINIEVDPDDFANLIKSQIGDEYKSYMAGRFSSDIELRKAVQQAALNHSTPAQQTMIGWLNEIK